jgi:hypothetical protein
MAHFTILEFHSPRAARVAALAAGALSAAAAAPSAAPAAVVSQANGIVTYQASPGEANQVFPFVENGRVRVREFNPATPLFAGVGCQILSDRLAECGGSGARVVVHLGDLNDTYFGTGTGSVPATVNGDAGNDILVDGAGPARRETYNGGGGSDTAAYFLSNASVRLSLDGLSNDGEAGEGDLIAPDVENLEGGSQADALTGNGAANTLRGNNGADTLTALGGDDRFEEGAATNGADLIVGGANVDRVLYRERTAAGVRVSLDGAADDGQIGEADNILPDVENVTGTRFADTLIGSDLANTFASLGGNDFVDPRAGSDLVFAGDGDDRLQLRDGVRDEGHGNAGNDTIVRDLIDNVTN